MSEEEKIPPEEIPQAQPVKKEPADENISSAESIDETEQLQIEQSEIPMTIGTTNYKPQTENMEVHKHPHHVTHKKKWGEYLLEFLMIFLAVFLGFVAENIRENSVEKERGKEYINTLVEDIQLDITDLKKQIEFREIVEKRIDSLFDLFQKPDRKNFTAEIYFLSRRTTRASNLSYHDRTIQQLKMSEIL